MQDSLNDKLAYNYPCKPTEACIDYEEYDPCESSDDITEKDLAVLLKEEAAKLEKEKEKNAADKGKQVDGETEKKAKGLSEADDKQRQLTQADIKQEEEEENSGKKKACKFVKNPFFTDRLRLSTSHLPLPPPGPPPQNFPLADEDSTTKICPKKKKKCRKDDKSKGKTGEDDGKGKADSGEKNGKGKEGEGKDGKDGEGNEEGKDGEGNEDGKDGEDDGGNKNCFKEKIKKDTKKSCKRQSDERPRCKRKESEVSVDFGPRSIPLSLKDPQTSPKDIPEVERQLLMACGKSQEDLCKKKCKKKPGEK